MEISYIAALWLWRTIDKIHLKLIILDFAILEKDFDCACGDVIVKLTAQYKINYQSGGPGKLEAFLELIKAEFDKAATEFIELNELNGNTEALHLINGMAKKKAKSCIDVYGKIMK